MSGSTLPSKGSITSPSPHCAVRFVYRDRNLQRGVQRGRIMQYGGHANISFAVVRLVVRQPPSVRPSLFGFRSWVRMGKNAASVFPAEVAAASMTSLLLRQAARGSRLGLRCAAKFTSPCPQRP
jgi:hypothetical protein